MGSMCVRSFTFMQSGPPLACPPLIQRRTPDLGRFDLPGLFPQRDRGLRQYRPRQLARMMGPYPTMLRDRRRRRPAAADAPVHAIGRAHSARAGVATHALPRSLGDVVRRMVTGQVGHAVDRAGKRTSAITAAISLNSTYATANRLAVVLAPIAASAELVAVPMFCPTINAQAWSSATAPA